MARLDGRGAFITSLYVSGGQLPVDTAAAVQ